MKRRKLANLQRITKCHHGSIVENELKEDHPSFKPNDKDFEHFSEPGDGGIQSKA